MQFEKYALSLKFTAIVLNEPGAAHMMPGQYNPNMEWHCTLQPSPVQCSLNRAGATKVTTKSFNLIHKISKV